MSVSQNNSRTVRLPQRAEGNQIVALPILVRKLPQPVKRIIGDLSDLERVMVGMDFRPLSFKR